MKVIKVLNNSLILAQDSSGQESILMGKGIGFHLSVGESVSMDKVEKTYVLQGADLPDKMAQLSQSTDEIFFTLASQIIQEAKEKYGLHLSDYIYLALTDHLAFAAKRFEENLPIELFHFPELQVSNPYETALGHYALDLIEAELGMRLPEPEVGSIAMHFINAQQTNPYAHDNQQVNKIVDDILNIIQYRFKIVYNTSSMSYIRAVSHLQFFAIRLIRDQLLEEEKNTFLYDHIMASCRAEQECADVIDIYVHRTFGRHITSQEKMYLVLHIHRLIETIDIFL